MTRVTMLTAPSFRLAAAFLVTTVATIAATSALAQDSPVPPPESGGRGQTETGFSPPANIEQCAAIAQGVRRLECYDYFLYPGESDTADNDGVDPDLVDAVESLGIDTEELKKTQQEPRNPSLVEQIIARQQALFSYSESFVNHQANYVLPVTYVDPVNNAPVSANFGREPLQENFSNVEAKFQFSVRLPILTGIFDDRTKLWVAYTQLSFWQAYNSDESSPFRESNYEPEIFFTYRPGISIGPGSIDLVSIGFNHQSNGRSDPLSRSWNRILGNIVYSNDRWIFSVSPWYRIPESDGDDNNPDIHKYLGYADYAVIYKLPSGTALGLRFKNNLDWDNNRTSFRLDYTFPLSDSLNAYVQYYHGWGESLIDYNHHVKRIGVGITIADWL